MADEITIEIRADMTAFRRDVKSALDAGTAQVRQFKSALDSSVGSVNALGSSLGGLKAAFAAIGGAFVLKQIGEAAIQSAINIDKTRQTIAALIGGVDAANKKIAELRKLAQSSPGVTSSLATDLFAQFKALKTVADSTINDVIKSIGRLNTVFAIPDVKTFGRNLVQIFTGGFEKDQIKEALQSVPIFEQLLEEAFGTKDGAKLRKLKDAGKLTMETFLQGLNEKINERFKDVQDSIGSLFEKLKDRVTVALEPLGKELTKILLPVFDDAVKKVEQYGSSAARVFAQNRNDIIATAKEITAMTVEIGKLIGKIIEVGSKSGIFKFLARSAGAIQDIIDDPFSLQFVGPKERAAVQVFEKLERDAEIAKRAAAMSPLERQNFALRTGNLALAPTPQELREFARSTGNKQLLAMLPPEPRATSGTGGTGGGGGKTGGADAGVSASNRKRQLTELEQAIKDTEKIAAAVEALEKREGELFQKEVALAVIRLQREEFEKQRADLGFVEALKVLGKPLPLKLPNISQPRGLPATALGSPLSVGSPADLTPDTANALDASRTRTQQFDQRLRIEEIRIQNQVTTGLLSESEARRELNAVRAASRDEIIKLLEEQRNLVGAGSEAGLQFTVEIEQTRLLGVELSNTQRFMRGFNSQVDSVGDAFDRFGANVSSAFRNVRDLFNGLKSAVLGFFNDLLGQSLQNLVRNTLGGVFGNLSKSLGGIFSGAGGNVFRTPSTFGNAVQAFAGAAGGDGISVPPSISSGISQFFGASVPRTANVASGGIDDFFGASVPRTAGNTGFSFGALGKSFAAAAPAIGLGLGGGLGGQSAFGQIAGSAGGLLAGGAVAGFSGALGATATAFFTNPFTIAIGAGLLVGSFFLGKAKQRRQDEEASGQMLTSALQGIDQLAQAVGSGQISSMAEARAVFENQILGQFIQGINGLKTKSVRESRLTNQVRDLRNVFDARIPPLIAEQERKATDARRFAAIDSRLVPQFARGGTTLGGLALLHPGEKVLNFAQQASVIRQSNPQVFERAGVPGVKNPPIFDTGGTFGGGSLSPSRSPGGGTVVIDKLFISVDAEGIAIEGMSGRNGEQIVVNHIENVNLRKGRR